MRTRTLVATAVLFLICGLSFACDQLPQPVALTMPDEKQVDEIGRFDGLPLTLAVDPGSRVTGPVILVLKATNVTDHSRSFSIFHTTQPSHEFTVWLLIGDKQVPLSQYGAQEQARQTVSISVDSGGPPGELKAGESKSMQVNLSELFQITAPGDYTVIVEQGPFMDNNDPTRAINAAKTSFTLLP